MRMVVLCMVAALTSETQCWFLGIDPATSGAISVVAVLVTVLLIRVGVV